MDENLLTHCPICNSIINKKNLKKHLWKVHKSRKTQQPKPRVLADDERIEKIKMHNYELLLKASYIWNIKFLDEEQKIKRGEILDELNSLVSKQIESSPESNYLKMIVETLLKRPTIQEYRDSCEKIFITWDNIEFLNNTIKIKHKDHFGIKPIKVSDSRESLNLIKVEYFKRVYNANIYKLYLKNNEVVESVSSDLKKIKAVIEIKLEEDQKKTKKNQTSNLLNERVFPKNADSYQIIDTIKSLPEIRFKFIKTAAKFLNENDRVIALDENNNSNIEEALVFIYKRSNLNFILWENVNPGRGAYLFEFTSRNFEKELSRFVTLIKGPYANKREKFFRSEDNFGLEYRSKTFLNHEDIGRFSKQIKNKLFWGDGS